MRSTVPLQLNTVKLILFIALNFHIYVLNDISPSNFAFLLSEQYTGTRESRVSIFFSIPGKEFLDFRESRLTRPPDNRPIVSGIIVTGRCALAISRSLVASLARIPDARTPRNKRQWRISSSNMEVLAPFALSDPSRSPRARP